MAEWHEHLQNAAAAGRRQAGRHLRRLHGNDHKWIMIRTEEEENRGRRRKEEGSSTPADDAERDLDMHHLIGNKIT